MQIDELWQKSKTYGIQQIEWEFKQVLECIPDNAVGIEIGCYSGGTTIAFAHLCKKLATIDINKIFNTTEVESITEHKFFIGNSTSESIIESVKEFIGVQQADFLFIDGDHSAEGALKDYENYKDLVKSGGMIFFHDIVDSESHRNQNCYVSQAWKVVRDKHINFSEFLKGEDWAGIGMVLTD